MEQRLIIAKFVFIVSFFKANLPNLISAKFPTIQYFICQEQCCPGIDQCYCSGCVTLWGFLWYHIELPTHIIIVYKCQCGCGFVNQPTMCCVGSTPCVVWVVHHKPLLSIPGCTVLTQTTVCAQCAWCCLSSPWAAELAHYSSNDQTKHAQVN